MSRTRRSLPISRCLLLAFSLAAGSVVAVETNGALAADAPPVEVVFGAVADARVLASSPGANYGGISRLDVDSPGEESYVRFGVSGVTGSVVSATLRLFVRNGSSDGPSLYETGGGWSESGITWNNRPAAVGGALADVGVAPADTWVEFDLTGHVAGDGVYDFVLRPDSSDGVRFNSREKSPSPELVLVVGGGSGNLPPVAVDDVVSTVEGVGVTVDVAANDGDPDGGLDLGSVSTGCGGCVVPEHGSLVNNGDGTFGYTPVSGFVGGDGFVYEICDTLGACDTAAVTITVNSGNLPPVAVDDVVSTVEGVGVTVDVAANDGDPDGGLDLGSVSTGCGGCVVPEHGSLVNNGDGTFGYTPVSGFVGGDGFVYEICDTLGACDTAAVTITVNSGNLPPVAVDDVVSTVEGVGVTVDVAANDGDPDGGLDLGSVSTGCGGCVVPEHGSLVNNGDGTFGYTPVSGFVGGDGFVYEICDTLGACDTAAVTITVNSAGGEVVFGAVADARVLASSPGANYGGISRLDVDSPGEESYVRFGVSGVTGSVVSATLRLFVRNGSSDGPSLYETGGGWSESGITWNNRPAAVGGALADVGVAPADTWVEFDLTGHVAGDGVYDFVLRPDSSDGVRFNSREKSPSPELVLVVGGGSGNLPPVAVDDVVSTVEGVGVTVDVAANDGDPDGGLDLGSVSTGCGGCVVPEHGSLVNNGDGTFGYTPVSGFVGGDGFVYEICDTLGACDTAAVTITVNSADAVTFVGAGDIADCSRTSDEATAQLLDTIPGTVFTVGDNVYPNGSANVFNDCYEPTWGRHKDRTHPSVGDNEYDSTDAAPYFDYFGAAAGDPTKGYYSYEVGNWHIISLNSNCSEIGGCEPDSAQGLWLQADLDAHPNACILAIHHEPLFSSKGGDGDLIDFWEPLYAAGADIVISGHRHNYERFAQQDPSGSADPGRGIRQFVVGTGGSGLSSFDGGVAANSEVRNDSAHGVLKLTLRPTSYDWEFVPVSGASFTDSGSASCVAP